jgi:hypothetical protein
MKLLGVMPLYNEADCVHVGLSAMRHAGCDETHVFDHGSTDGGGGIAKVEGAKIHLVRREDVPIVGEDGRFSFKFWYVVAAWILSKKDSFDWVYWGDADELLRQPDGRLATKASLIDEADRGVDVIRPLIREFQLTRSDGDESVNYLERMRYYRENKMGHSPRAWKIHLTPPDLPAGTHVQDRKSGELLTDHYVHWPEGTVVSNNQWLLDIYLFRSYVQAWSKLYADGRVALDGSPWFAHMMTSDRKVSRIHLYHQSKHLKHEARELEMPA